MTKDDFKKEIMVRQKKSRFDVVVVVVVVFFIKCTLSNSIKWSLVLLLQ